MHRLTADRPSIASAFFGGRFCGRLVDVHSGLSDPHNGGRTVAVVRFASGRRVVYKPRSLGLEAALYRLVAWWNRRAGRLSLLAPRVLDRGRYGWMAFVAHTPCADRRAAGRYWERAGALLALAGLLDATDLHYGNVIAHGEHPVLVDAETLLQPRWPGEERSLLDTGLVPSWIRGPDGGSYDVSGFGAIAPQWYQGAPVPLRENIVRIGNDIVSPAVFADRLEAGLLRAGAVLCARSEELVAAGGPLRGFHHRRVRVMLRHTETYRAARHRGLDAASLLRPVRDPRVRAAIAAAERAALVRGDIPRFVARTDSGVAALIARARTLTVEYFAEQARLLRTALALWDLGGELATSVQQQHEADVEQGGPREEKRDKPAHARAVSL